jgi:hypothetical protein
MAESHHPSIQRHRTGLALLHVLQCAAPVPPHAGALAPAPGWFMRGKLTATTHLGQTIESAQSYGSGLLLTGRGEDGRVVQVVADHAIAGTGYRPDLRRLPFLESSLREEIAQIENTPHLTDHFETSVPGLYVTGPLAAYAFGPLMRFMVGAEYAAPRLAAHLSRTRMRAVA